MFETFIPFVIRLKTPFIPDERTARACELPTLQAPRRNQFRHPSVFYQPSAPAQESALS